METYWYEENAVNNDQNNYDDEWVRFGLRLVVSSALHPFEYSKVLIQLGYEPIPARHGRSIFGRQIMVLPNIFQYTGYIRRVDGFFGLYRGLTPKLVGSIIGSIFSERIADNCGFVAIPEEKNKNSEKLSEEEEYNRFQYNMKRDLIIHASGIIITHPFHVISLRMMAQFIGRESLYNSILGSFGEIYKNEGILGFFSGIIPKLICDLACVVLTSSTCYVVNKYIISDKDSRQYFASFTQFIYSSLMYPLQVVSTCMCISGSQLAAAKPPIMPNYSSWIDCWHDLKIRGELKRGSSLFWRSAPMGKSTISKFNYAPMPILSKYS